MPVMINYYFIPQMSQHPALVVMEQDAVVRRTGFMVHEDTESGDNSVLWNLDRLDQRDNALDQSYDPAGDGSNVDIYILDSGMRLTHQDLEGRAQYMGYDAVDDLVGGHKQGLDDCDGHGTHCAGVAAGKKFGVAKNASIYNARVLECDGSGLVSGIVKAIEFIIKQNQEHERRAVISLSLDVKNSVSLDKAMEAAADSGIVGVGAAGNQAAYSCDYSPGRSSKSIAVGATNKEDEVTSFTNTGKCTTIMAPGARITSAWYDCDTCTKTISGTSMATPHVAGYAAIVLSQDSELTAEQVMQKMINESTKDAVKIMSGSVEETPNRLLYVTSKASVAAGEMTE